MSTTLTIRNLDKGVKQKLRERAARHQRSMEAEVRDILSHAVTETLSASTESPEETRVRLKNVIGIWKDRGTTDELMKLTRGGTDLVDCLVDTNVISDVVTQDEK